MTQAQQLAGLKEIYNSTTEVLKGRIEEAEASKEPADQKRIKRDATLGVLENKWDPILSEASKTPT